MPSPMLRQKLGCATGGCGGGSGSRHTAMAAQQHQAGMQDRAAARRRSGRPVEAQAMPMSWPTNCSAVASATARGRLPLATDGQQRIARRHGEGADRAGREAVGDQQRIAEAARRQHGRQHQRRHGVEHVVAQQQPARVAAVGRPGRPAAGTAAGRHQGRLRHAHGEGIHVQHDRDQPREQHHLDAERHEPAAEPQQVDGEDRDGMGLSCLPEYTISCRNLVPLAHLIVKDTGSCPTPRSRRWRSGRRCRHSTAPLW